ncbi:ER membrane glycoprotein subunit of the GPI transamidase complex-like protein [Puccinia graminis f. sp. tritici]|uniref:GPI mannosyltransferase 2 n=1 Tax=Puccinia graminis f. sp. tritici TaxID=56615 RepID=A0A5B0SLE3_PUCGR|nr:ER membrane glycoprotein subunit of the GPI transamidase complex-like protein [Puccinia graminis f. sp. tritici]KAA1138365.1 ER membrane glycoprotein subunit of the GPI transamidase complex-like protein [Puccinia graminis f. sp. tritici]
MSTLIKILLLSILVRLISFIILLLLTNPISSFDQSAQIKHPPAQQSLIRWDTLHFLTTNSRTAEQDWAFATGITSLLSHYSILTTSLLAATASILSTLILYQLTLQLSHSTSYSALVCLLHLFSPSPSTQVVPYTEPFYALFSFAAIYLIEAKHHWPAAILAGIATSFRPIGVIQCLLWIPQWTIHLNQLINNPKHSSALIRFITTSLKTLLLALITSAPFIYDQFSAYKHYCYQSSSPRPWCSNRIPSIYTFVQSHYWNNGFLNYWTFNQLPLFIISFPIYWASFAGIWNYYGSTRFMTPKTHQSKPDEAKLVIKQSGYRPFLDPRLQIHILIQLLLTSLLLFNSHVQIILRQIATIPAFWWGLADGISRHWNQQPSSNQHKSHQIAHSYWAWWFPWIVVWAPISLVLWAGFYPPA